MAIKVVQNGIGKMGTAVLKRLLNEEDIEVIAIIDPNPSITEGVELAREYGIRIEDSIDRLRIEDSITSSENVFVDFSSPEGFKTACSYAAERGINIISGTTPVPKEYEEVVRESIIESGVRGVLAPNFSPEVNKFFKQMKYVGQTTDPKASVSIHEIHRYEKMKTAGTAKTIAETLCQTMRKKGYILLREGKAFNPLGSEIAMPKKFSEDWVQVSCERFADEPGTHIVRTGTERDYIEYRVRATRDSTTYGAVKAIRFASNPDIRPGVYDFMDVLDTFKV